MTSGPLIYLESRGDAIAIDSSSGHEVWRYDPIGRVAGQPVNVNGTVYLSTYRPSGSQHQVDSRSVGVYALDAETAELRTCFNIPEGLGSGPLVSGDNVYVGSVLGTAYALGASGTALLWASTLDAPWAVDLRSTPVAMGDLVVFGAVWTDPHSFPGDRGGAVYALNQSTGDTAWTFERVSAGGVETPLIARGSLLYVASQGGDPVTPEGWAGQTEPGLVQALDAETGAEVWRYPVGAAAVQIAYHDGVVLAAHRHLTALTGDVGRGIWHWRANEGSLRQVPPVVHGGHVYVATDQGIYAVGVEHGQSAWNMSVALVQGLIPVADGGLVAWGGESMLQGGTVLRHMVPFTESIDWSHVLRPPRSLEALLNVGDHLVGISNDRLFGISASDGQIDWTRSVEAWVMTSEPTENHVIVAVHADPTPGDPRSRGRDYEVVAVAAADGTLRWRVELGGSRIYSLQSSHDAVLVEAVDQVLSLDASDGRIRWTRQKDDLWREEPVTGGLPDTRRGSLVVKMGHDLLALDAETGNTISKVPVWDRATWTGASYESARSRNLALLGSPSSLTAVDISTGDEIWNQSMTDGQVVGAAESDGKLAITTYRMVSMFDAHSGELLWARDFGVNVTDGVPGLTKPAFLGGVVVVGSNDKRVYGLDPETGMPVLVFETAGPIRTTPTGDEGMVYFASGDGAMYAVGMKRLGAPAGDGHADSDRDGHRADVDRSPGADSMEGPSSAAGGHSDGDGAPDGVKLVPASGGLVSAFCVVVVAGLHVRSFSATERLGRRRLRRPPAR